MGNLDPACLSALGRRELRVGDGSSAAGSQGTHGKLELPQASEEILPERELEISAHFADFRDQDGFGSLVEYLCCLLMTDILSIDQRNRLKYRSH